MDKTGGNPSRLEILEKEGWRRQFAAEEPRLSEAVEIYREAGLEVHLEPVTVGPACKPCGAKRPEPECRVCYEGEEGRFKLIFTRPRGKESAPEDEPS